MQRRARLEEGQKVIIAQFEAVDKRFDSLIREMNQRFEALDKRIDLIDNHSYFLAILGAIIELMAYIIWDRKTAFD